MKNRRNIFTSFLIVLLILTNSRYIYSQTICTDVEELYRKRHKIRDMTYGHPYTIFDRHNKNYINLDSAIANIRERITIENKHNDTLNGPIFKAYQKIYSKAIKSMPTDNGMESDKSVSNLAIWAKNNAFVNLIGMDDNGLLIDVLHPSGYNRDAFQFNATVAFLNLTGEIKSDNSYMQGYSRSLIQWLQAYDLLKASAASSELAGTRAYFNNTDSDRNKDKCSPRNKLRKLTRDIYKESMGINGIMTSRTGWKKNHGIAAASCLLMAAQVLNDAGVELNYGQFFFGWIWGEGTNWPRPNYSPINWNKEAQDAFDDNLFIGYHWWPVDNVPPLLDMLAQRM
jgi:hypothetical protein